MIEALTTLEIRLPESLEDITERSLSQCVRWDYFSKQLDERVISEFKKGVFERYFDEIGVPSDEVKEEIELAKDLVLLAIIKPRKRKVPYSEIYNDFDRYLRFLLEQYKKGIPREGVSTIKNEPYLVCEDIIKRINKTLTKLEMGKPTLERKLKIIKQASQNVPQIVTIVNDRDYSIVDVPNGNAYVDADNLLKEGNQRANYFKSILLENSLRIIGFSELKNIVIVPYTFGQSMYLHKLEPRTSVSYAEIINSFIGKDPKDASKIGDLLKLRMMVRKEDKEKLKSEGLIDDSFTKDYNPSIREGKVLIRLEGTLKRLESYKEKLSKPYIEQNLSLIPM